MDVLIGLIAIGVGGIVAGVLGAWIGRRRASRRQSPLCFPPSMVHEAPPPQYDRLIIIDTQAVRWAHLYAEMRRPAERLIEDVRARHRIPIGSAQGWTCPHMRALAAAVERHQADEWIVLPDDGEGLAD